MKPLKLLSSTILVAALVLPATPTLGERATLIHVYPVKPVLKERVYIDASSSSLEQILSLRRALRANGAEKVNLHLPSTIVCEVPVGMNLGEFSSIASFTWYREHDVSLAMASPARYELTDIQQCYEMARKLPAGPLHAPAEGASAFDDEVYTVPESVVEAVKERNAMLRAAGAEGPRGVNQNSEFMVGDICVNAVFPESNQSGPDWEDWSDRELSDVQLAVTSGMLGYQAQFPWAPMDFVFNYYRRAPTQYEPIQHNSGTDPIWIKDIMERQGIVVDGSKTEDGGAMVMVHEFNERARKRYGTDWAFTLFIANSEKAPRHRFNTGAYTAYAFLGGPYNVCPFPAGENPEGIDPILLASQIYMHESVHVFWGLDEYPAAPVDCKVQSGYLFYPNMNKQTIPPSGELIGCPDYVDCIMWGAKYDLARIICDWTAGQIGTIDYNRNSIVDVFDSAPIIQFEGAVRETTLVPEFTFDFTAVSTPVWSQNLYFTDQDRRSYASALKSATIGVGGTGVTKLVPIDGKWDEPEEDLSFKISGLSAGRSVLDIEATNVFGRKSDTFQKEIFFIGVKYALFQIQPGDGGITVKWNTVGRTFGAKFDLYRYETVDGKRVETLVKQQVPATGPRVDGFQPFACKDTSVVAGRQYQYQVRGYFTLTVNGKMTDFHPDSQVFTTRAPLPISSGQIVSLVSPNPFNESTTISVDVPRSFAPPSGDPGSSTGLRREIPTEFDITIYDVLGRRVKQLFAGASPAGIGTFVWDGTNDRNDPVPSGIYFIRTNIAGAAHVKKVVLVH